MPIKPENRHHYRTPSWKEASAIVRERAGGACECVGECGAPHLGRCAAPNGKAVMRDKAQPWRYVVGVFEHRGTGARPPARVVLTVAHLDHNAGTDDPERMRHFCQLCHNRYDRAHRAANAAVTRAERAAARSGQARLPLGGGRS